MENDTKKRLVIIGGGFAGLNVAKRIDKKLYDVVLVDKHNYNSFPPLFYQVASSGLEPASISFPFRREFNKGKYKGCRYHMGEVREIDAEAKRVHTQYETIPYDVLVIAAGTTNNFFGNADLEKHVFTLKSTPEAIRCRNEVLDRLERASLTHDAELRKRLLTFTVIGGGPAGVEIAGALGEMKKFVLKREYPGISPEEVKVIIVEGSDKLLRTMSERSSADALTALKQLMVEVRLNITMTSYVDGVATFSDGTTLETDTLIWSAGVTGVPFKFTDGFKADHGGRFKVDEYNAVEGLKDVYAIGDIALMETDKWPHGHPQVAQAAIQQGQNLARTLNKPHKAEPFDYYDKGSMATIGRNRAVVDMGKIHLSGWFAWLVWMFIHLISLLGMRNKFVVLINWMWSYCNFSSSLRLMLRPGKYPNRSYWDR